MALPTLIEQNRCGFESIRFDKKLHGAKREATFQHRCSSMTKSLPEQTLVFFIFMDQQQAEI